MTISPPSPPSTTFVELPSRLRDGLLADVERTGAAALKRELHDTVLQDVLYLAMQLTRMEEEHEGAGEVPELASLARETYQKFRETLGKSPLPEKAPRTLWQLVGHQSDWFKRRTGEELDIRWQAYGDEVVLPEYVSLNLCRIVHEALWNAWVHAEARQTTLEVGRGREGVTITISDDGRGFSPDDVPELHFGLANMAERAASIGARFNIETEQGRGTTIRIVLPHTMRNGGMSWQHKLS